MSNRDLSTPDTIVHTVTVIIGAVVGLTFLFGFGNVLNLALRLGVPPWVAPLVAPAVDLSVIGLLLGIRYLAINGATLDHLRPARRLLIFSSLVTLALNVAEPVISGRFGKAAFDAVGPLLLIDWAEVGPNLLAALASAVSRLGDLSTDSDRQGSVDEDLLNRARREDLHHWTTHRRPISSEKLRKRLRIGAGKARNLVASVRSEYGIGLDQRLADDGPIAKSSVSAA